MFKFGFVDRFSGSVVMTGDVSSVEAALIAVLQGLGRDFRLLQHCCNADIKIKLSRGSMKGRILIVDDDPIVRLDIRKYIRSS